MNTYDAAQQDMKDTTRDYACGEDHSKAACLLIHGFAGSPFEMEHLAPVLERLGCMVDLPTLPGHDTNIADFRRTYFRDWLTHAEDRLRILLECDKKVFVIGFSMGAAIALTLAAKYPVAGAVALSAPWQTYRLFPPKRSSWMVLAPLLKYFKPEIALKPPREESRAIAPFRGYDGPLCLPQVHSLELGIRAMRKLLPDLRCPLLMMHDLRDNVCPPEGAVKIARLCSSDDLKLRFTNMKERVTNHHMITTHEETHELVIEEVKEFVSRLL